MQTDGGATSRPHPKLPEQQCELSFVLQRQSGEYDATDLEDRYETRLRAMIDRKLKGEGIDLVAQEPQVQTGNVIVESCLRRRC